MSSDKPFRVTWKAGEIVVHAATPQRALEIAVEYLRVADAGRLNTQPVLEELLTRIGE
jgi:hypothetical protein